MEKKDGTQMKGHVVTSLGGRGNVVAIRHGHSLKSTVHECSRRQVKDAGFGMPIRQAENSSGMDGGSRKLCVCKEDSEVSNDRIVGEIDE